MVVKKGILLIIIVAISILSIMFIYASEFGYNTIEDPNSLFGEIEFDGGWMDGGCTIVDGDIYCQQAFLVNISALNVTKQNLTILDFLDVDGDFMVQGGSDFFVDSSSGNVGIGTTSPDSKLQIDGNFTSETNATDSIGTLAIQWLSGFFVDLFVSGDLEVEGNFTGNQIYGEMWNHSDTGFIIDLVTIMVYENITDLTDGSNNGFTLSNSKLISQVEGTYHIDYTMSFSGGANSEIGFAVGIGGQEQHQTHSHRKIGTGGDIGNTGGTGIITVNVGDEITLMARDEANPVQDITVVAVNLNLWRIGN